MDLFDTLTFVEILVRTTFLGTLSLTVPLRASSCRHMYRGSVFLNTACPYPSTTCAKTQKLNE
jgi:hypothetical protein